MHAPAVVMLVISMAVLWGGFVSSIVMLRHAAPLPDDGDSQD